MLIRASALRTCEAGAVDILHTVIVNEEALLPSHEHGIDGSVGRQKRALELVLYMPEGGEAAPVNHVLLILRSPFACEKAMPGTDDLVVKVRQQLGPIVGESTNP